jgi:hypothetical protein
MKKKHLILGLCAAVLIAAGSITLTGCPGDDYPTEPAPEDTTGCPNGPPQRPVLPSPTLSLADIDEGITRLDVANVPIESIRLERQGKEIVIRITLQ